MIKIFRQSRSLRQITNLLILFVLLGCNSNNVPQKKGFKPDVQNAADNFDIQVKILDSLSVAFIHHDKSEINLYWNKVIKDKEIFVKLLFLFEGRNDKAGWYWYDTSFHIFSSREYVIPSKNIAALFLINAIHNNNIAFAMSRDLYNNADIFTIVDSSNGSTPTSDINFAELWKLAKQNVFEPNTRLFEGSNIYWVGEKGGKINKKNIKRTKWSYFG